MEPRLTIKGKAAGDSTSGYFYVAFYAGHGILVTGRTTNWSLWWILLS